MDVLKPDIEEIDGILYRINFSDDYVSMKEAEITPYIEHDDDDDEIGCASEVVEEEDVEVHILDNGRYQISFDVPQIFHRYIIGHRGETKQRLEHTSKSHIKVPRRGEFGDIVITGRDRSKVLWVYHSIKNIVAASKSKLPYTHFVSLPLINSPTFRNRFLRFKNEVLQNFGSSHNITENLFQNPNKLHITIGMLTLTDDAERKLAVDTLMACKTNIINPMLKQRSLTVHVKGLEIMNDDPSDVRVLYTKLENNASYELLKEMSERIVDVFVEKKLMTKTRDLKIHITLLNSIFPYDSILDKKEKVKTIDASGILEVYKEYDFGEIEINSIHLSQLHTEAYDGYYLPSCKITFY